IQDEVAPPPGRVTSAEGAAGFFLDTRLNDAFRAVNRLLKAGEEVQRLQRPFFGKGTARTTGDFFIPHKATTLPLLEKLAAELGTSFVGSAEAPGTEAAASQPVRIALVDRFGGSMTSGWTRWLLERFEYPFKVVTADELAEGGLAKNFDVLVLVEEAMLSGTMKEQVPQLKQFLEGGGTIIAI